MKGNETQRKKRNVITHDLTIEELKGYPVLEQITDEQAIHIIESLKELSILVIYASEKLNNIKGIEKKET